MKAAAVALLVGFLSACGTKADPPRTEPPKPEPSKPREPEESSSRVKNPLGLSDDEWRKRLTPEEYRVCREQGTERPNTGTLLHYKGDGTFLCKACDHPLFSSKTKFESGSGWPSFYQPLSKEAVAERGDFSHGLSRIEVNCAKCGSHLGHVFQDGPEPTGLRYCMNSGALKIKEKETRK